MTVFEDVKKPFNLFTLLLAIIGIILTVFFYFKSQKVKDISYLLNEPSSLIFDSKNASSAIKVIEKDSNIVSGDVYLLTGSIWNSGDYPISKDEVRLPLSITLSNSIRIIDFKIIQQKDSAIANFVLSKEKPNSLNISWKYFDPSFGFKFQIMYVGKGISEFKLNGKILDIKKFTEVEMIEKQNGFLKWWNLIAPIFILYFSASQLISNKKRTIIPYKINLFLMILGVILLLFSIWTYFIYQTTSPI